MPLPCQRREIEENEKSKKKRERERRREKKGGIGREGRVRRSRGRIEGQQQVSGGDDSSSTDENEGEQRMESGVG